LHNQTNYLGGLELTGSVNKQDRITIGLTSLEPERLHKNPNNPRLLFKKEPLQLLKKSIKEIGILVPLIAYWSETKKNYYILDGQRRWQCALELKEEGEEKVQKIPVNLIKEPTTIANILTMFNIHNVREQWELTPTALKLEVIMRMVKTKDDKELARLTGLTAWNVRRCKSLLTFDKKYLDMTLILDDAEKVKGDFFVELYPVLSLIEKNTPEIVKDYPKNRVIDAMLEKNRRGKIVAVTDFRYLTKMIRSIKKGASRSKIVEMIRRVIDDRDLSLKEAFEMGAKIFYDAENIEKVCTSLGASLEEVPWEEIKRDSSIVLALRRLRDSIDAVLPRVGRKGKDPSRA